MKPRLHASLIITAVLCITMGFLSFAQEGPQESFVVEDLQLISLASSGARIGAICKDGSRSSATGRGACSHHGGVARWLYADEPATPLEPVEVTPAQPVLDIPATTTSQIRLRWVDDSRDETGFKIERKSQGGSFSQVATVGANVTTYSDTELSPATTYCYRVRAFNAAGYSSYSNERCATTADIAPRAQSMSIVLILGILGGIALLFFVFAL